jgi:hypothetical protein
MEFTMSRIIPVRFVVAALAFGAIASPALAMTGAESALDLTISRQFELTNTSPANAPAIHIDTRGTSAADGVLAMSRGLVHELPGSIIR